MKKFKNLKMMQVRVTRIVFREGKDVTGADYKMMQVYFNSANEGVGGFEARDLNMSFGETTDTYARFWPLPKKAVTEKSGEVIKVIDAETLMKATLPQQITQSIKTPIEGVEFDPDNEDTYELKEVTEERPALLDAKWLSWKTSLPRPKGDKYAIRDFIDEHPNEVPMRIAVATMQLSNDTATRWRLIDKTGKPIVRHIHGREEPIEETETTVCWQCTYGEVVDDETGRGTGEFDFNWDQDPDVVLENIRKQRYEPVKARNEGEPVKARNEGEQQETQEPSTDELLA